MNTYSPLWFRTFLETIPVEQTEEEVSFLSRQLPLPRYSRVLDVPCGEGRHANRLAARGYRVFGTDLDAAALKKARQFAPPGAQYWQGDLRCLAAGMDKFDGLLCLWQSFGCFDPPTNREVLYQIATRLRPGGRLVLDIYHRLFFAAHQGVHLTQRQDQTITETKIVTGNHLRVNLHYGGGQADEFNWEIFTPEEIGALGEAAGLRTCLACTGFDEGLSPSPAAPRMQIVFERRA